MRPINFVKLSVFLIFLTAANLSVFAQGVIVPQICDIRPRCPRPVPPPPARRLPVSLPVKSIDIDVQIRGQIAVTRVEQIFRNDSPYVLEGTYFFPIPENASVEGFAIWENGKKLTGEIRSRDEARKIYDEIVRKMLDPGLLEYAGRDLFQASIFPIPANSEKKLEIKYTQILKAESGTVSYRYPLGVGKNLRQNPFREDVPGSESVPRPSGNFQPPIGSVSGKIEISGTENLRNIYSPSHSIDVSGKGEKQKTISFETTKNSDDFQLFYGLSEKEFAFSLVTYREPGKDGYFLLTISPDEKQSDRKILEKDVVFVIDTSGSMADDGKMTKARPALSFGIKTLNPGDRFNIVGFSGDARLFEAGLIKIDEKTRRRGEEFIEGLKPSGGTNIGEALETALKQFDRSARPKMLVFLTDGLPTVGERDVDKIIRTAEQSEIRGLRLFSFGVGYDVNTRLLDKLASENSGVAEYIEPKEDLEVKISNFFTKINSPVLSDVRIDYGGLQTDLIYPRKVSDIFKGSQLILLGRYRNSSDLENISLKLTGKSSEEIREFRFENMDFPLRSTANDFLPRLWATRRVGWLIEEIRSNGENKELRNEIIELGTRFGIVTPYTSYLAADGSVQTLPANNRGFQVLEGDAAARVLRKETGRDAVRQSVRQRAMQSNATVGVQAESESSEKIYVENSSENLYVGTKNFLKIEGVWVDSETFEKTDLPAQQIKFGTAEFFKFLAEDKNLGVYLSIGKRIKILWKGKIYLISE